MSGNVSTFVQMAGSLMILVPFVLLRLKRVRPQSLGYIWLNLMGSTVLAVEAWHGHQWGFLLLEGTWAVVSMSSLVGRGSPVSH